MPDKEIAALFNHMDEAAVWLIAAWLASRDGSHINIFLDGKITHNGIVTDKMIHGGN